MKWFPQGSFCRHRLQSGATNHRVSGSPPTSSCFSVLDRDTKCQIAPQQGGQFPFKSTSTFLVLFINRYVASLNVLYVYSQPNFCASSDSSENSHLYLIMLKFFSLVMQVQHRLLYCIVVTHLPPSLALSRCVFEKK